MANALPTDHEPEMNASSKTHAKNMQSLILFAPRVAALLKSLSKKNINQAYTKTGQSIVHQKRGITLTDSPFEEKVSDTKSAWVLGIGTGLNVNQLLLHGYTLLVIETDLSLLNLVLQQHDWSKPISEGRLRFSLGNCSSNILHNLSLKRVANEIYNFYQEQDKSCVVFHNSSTTLQPNFYDEIQAIPKVWDRFEQMLDDTRPRRATGTDLLHDVVIISPNCYIFNELAESFRECGIDAFVISISDQGRTESYGAELLHALQKHPSKVILNRNRSAFEVENPLKDIKLEPYIECEQLVQWWWDTPNVATLIDFDSPESRHTNLSFARDLLPLLPFDSHWLPAAARQRFCQPQYQQQIDAIQPINFSFVGQARTELIVNSLGILTSTLSALVNNGYKKIVSEFNALAGMRAIYDYLVGLEKELETVLEELKNTHPKESYYLNYILKMSVTAAFRLAAVQTLIKHGFDVQVYGDESWVKNKIISHNHYRGPIAAEHLPALYRRTKVNLNFNFMQVSSTVNPKVLDISACGGVVLSDHRPEVELLYPQAYRRPFTFHDLDELPDIAAMLLNLNLVDYRQGIAEYTQQHHSMKARAHWIAEKFELFNSG